MKITQPENHEETILEPRANPEKESIFFAIEPRRGAKGCELLAANYEQGAHSAAYGSARAIPQVCVRVSKAAAISHRIKHAECSGRDSSLSLPPLANETLGLAATPPKERIKLIKPYLEVRLEAGGGAGEGHQRSLLPSLMLILDKELSKSFPSGSEGCGPPAAC